MGEDAIVWEALAGQAKRPARQPSKPAPAEAPPAGIRDWAPTDRPRERLLAAGPAQLSTAELLAVLLRCGASGEDAVSLARSLLREAGSLSALLSTPAATLLRRRGLGVAKVATLQCVLELARRVQHETLSRGPLLGKPALVRDYLSLLLQGRAREVFVVLFLDSQNRLIQADELFHGTLNQTAVYPREVLRRALEVNAASVILAHNHPSGVAEPSTADRSLTRVLQGALAQLDIAVLDHLIVAAGRHYSFAEQGLL